MKREEILKEIEREFYKASVVHPSMNSYHEGWATIREEVDELWDEIKKKNPNRARLYNEAVQIGAMALRFILDLNLGPQVPESEESFIESIKKLASEKELEEARFKAYDLGFAEGYESAYNEFDGGWKE